MDVGCIDEIDAGFDRKAQKAICRSLIELADDWPELSPSAECHRAEANFGDK